MNRHKARKPSWLLTVAAAYSLIPGCGDDDGNEPRQGTEIDAGSVAGPPGWAFDAGLVAHPDAGIVVQPPGDAGTDAGRITTPEDAGLDAQQPVVGLVALPPEDAGADADAGYILTGLVVL